MSDSTIGTDEIAAHLKSLVDNWDELKTLSDARADGYVLLNIDYSVTIYRRVTTPICIISMYIFVHIFVD